ncbi:MAG: c-type cytochrome, partial [Candidatus Eremiobacteraeota bacterium]|nr:c-type cytochrome [Candidatus Eremiobacteraeota bacterium]
YTLGEKHDVAGQSYYGTAWAPKGPDARGWITSLDANTGAVRWRYHAAAPVVAGVTPTAGGLVFTGDLAGNFLALDSATGKALRVENVGGPLAGGVLTYALDGTQYVAMTVGNVSRLTFKTSGTPTVIIMALNASAPPIARSVPAATAGASTAATASGEALFAQNCAGCHGSGGAGGIGPSLKGESKRKDLANLIQWIENPKPPMPKLYPKPLNESEVRSVAAYVETLP